jgi:hypothetical protein
MRSIKLLKLFFILSLGLFQAEYSFAGLFGPKTYEECILDGVKDAKTDAAVSLIHAACKKKFDKSKDNNEEVNYVKSCSVVWVGNKFVKGVPADVNDFSKIVTTTSPDSIYMPTRYIDRVPWQDIRKLINSHRNEMLKLCPGMTFD